MNEDMVNVPLGLFVFNVSVSKYSRRFADLAKFLGENGWEMVPEMQVADRVFFSTTCETQEVFTALSALTEQDREGMDLFLMLPEGEPERVGLEHDGVMPLLYTDKGIVINPDDMVAEVWAQRFAGE